MRQLLILSCLILLAIKQNTLTALSSTGAPPPSPVAEKLQQIHKLIEQKKDTEAIKLIKETVIFSKKIPEHSNLNILEFKNIIAIMYLKMQRYSEAERILKKLLSDNPQNTMILNNLGVVYLETRQFHKAEPLLLKVHLQNENFSLNLAYLYHETDQYLKAAPLIRKIQKITKLLSYRDNDVYLSSYKTYPLQNGYYVEEQNYTLYRPSAENSVFVADIDLSGTATADDQKEINSPIEKFSEILTFSNAGKFPEAIKIAKTIVQESENKKYENLIAQTKALGILTYLYTQSRQFYKAELQIKKLLEIKKEEINLRVSRKWHTSKNQINLGIHQIDLADIYKKTNRSKEAKRALQQARQTFKKALPTNHPYIRQIEYELKTKQ